MSQQPAAAQEGYRRRRNLEPGRVYPRLPAFYHSQARKNGETASAVFALTLVDLRNLDTQQVGVINTTTSYKIWASINSGRRSQETQWYFLVEYQGTACGMRRLVRGKRRRCGKARWLFGEARCSAVYRKTIRDGLLSRNCFTHSSVGNPTREDLPERRRKDSLAQKGQPSRDVSGAYDRRPLSLWPPVQLR